MRGLAAVGVLGLWAMMVSLSASGCGPATMPANAPPGGSLIAAAPDGFDERMLGVQVDANFRPGPGGGSLFPHAAAPVPVKLDQFSIERKLMSTADDMAANAQAWTVSFDLSSAQRERYATFRVLQLDSVYEIQPQANGPMLRPQPWAAYYVSKVYKGRRYEEVVYGTTSDFNARVAASFLDVADGSIGAFAHSHNLQSKRYGVGFQPLGTESMFARTREEVEHAYSRSPEPVVVAVEYTQLPSTRTSGAVIFPEPTKVTVQFTDLQVQSSGAETTSGTEWSMTAECSVNGDPQSQTTASLLKSLRVAPGTYRINVAMPPIFASDEDEIVCKVGGSYNRGWLTHSAKPLMVGSTGAVRVATIPMAGAPSGAQIQGHDANGANYVLSWTAFKERR